MLTCTFILALVAVTQAAPVDRRSDVLSDLTANAINPTAEGVDALGGQLNTIVGQVAGGDNSATKFVAGTTLPSTQEGVEIITGALDSRSEDNLVTELTGNAIDPTADGLDALDGQVSTIAGQVAGSDDSIASFVAGTTLPSTQEGVEILTGALNSRSEDNLVTALTGNAIDPTADGVDALGGQASTIVGQVAGSDDSIASFVAGTTLPSTQEGVEILTGALSQ